MIKLPLGTKVRINSLAWFMKNKDVNQCVNKNGYNYLFIKDMTRYCGKIVTITEVNINNDVIWYKINESIYGWHDWMFEEVVGENIQLGIL